MQVSAIGRVGVLGASAVLVVGLCGVGYAAGKITGADIKDGTVTTADVRNHTLKLKDLSPGARSGLEGDPGGLSDVYAVHKTAGTFLTGTTSTLLSLDLPDGKYLITATATMFPDDPGPANANCDLHINTTFADTSASASSEEAYGNLSTQLWIATAGDTVDFECSGTNAGVNQINITALTVGSITTP